MFYGSRIKFSVLYFQAVRKISTLSNNVSMKERDIVFLKQVILKMNFSAIPQNIFLSHLWENLYNTSIQKLGARRCENVWEIAILPIPSLISLRYNSEPEFLKGVCTLPLK